MRRVTALFAVVFALFALAPPVAADTTEPEPGSRPRETFEAVGFDAFTTDCGQSTCTDTIVYAEEVTTSSGDDFEYVCVDQYTYNIRTGRLTSFASGCSDTTNLTVAGDLSSATLAPTQVELCARRACDTITVSAELEAVGGSSTFRSRYVDRFDGCTFTYMDSGESRQASGTVTLDGETIAVDGSIREFTSTFSERCK